MKQDLSSEQEEALKAILKWVESAYRRGCTYIQSLDAENRFEIILTPPGQADQDWIDGAQKRVFREMTTNWGDGGR